MNVIHIVGPIALLVSLAAPASAQYTQGDDRATSGREVTAGEIQRLQDQIYDAGNEIDRLRSGDRADADRLRARLDDARDDVTYLRVKMRKQGSIDRGEYEEVRREIDAIRSDTRAEAGPTGTTGQRTARPGEVPAGTELDVRLDRALNSGTEEVEDRFTATTLADLSQDNRVLIPAGSTLRGVVSSVTRATRTERRGALTVAFDQINVNGRTYPMHATVSQALESEGIRGEAEKIGAGAGVGAIIGGILGGAKGALLGILIGGGGTIAATEGTDVNLPAGTILRVRIEEPLSIR